MVSAKLTLKAVWLLLTETNVGLWYASWYFGTLQAEVVHAEDISQASEEPVSSATRKLMLPTEMTA